MLEFNKNKLYTLSKKQGVHMYKKVDPIPVKDKIGLSIPEAAEYSGIGLNKINELLRDP